MIACIKFGKEQGAAFISHLDLIRVFERALRRAKLPLSFSEGFSPRPKLVFAHALGLGITSSGEYLDVALDEDVDPGEVFFRLKEALPSPFPLYDCAALPNGVTPAMAAITHASYVFTPEDESRILQINSMDTLISTRNRKGKVVTEDIRPHISLVEKTGSGVRVIVRAGSQKNVRPNALLAALGIEEPVPVHREDLYIETGGRLITPLMRTE